MSRIVMTLSWLSVFPYAYIAFFLGNWVGDSAKTPQAAAALFWTYLSVYPVAVVVCNLLAGRMRSAGKTGQAAVMSLVPFGVLAAAWVLFASFVNVLCRLFA